MQKSRPWISLLPFFILILVLQSPLALGQDEFHICGPYYVDKELGNFFTSQTFDKNEKQLICGNDKPGWKKISPQEVEYFVRRYLEDRGYFEVEVVYQDQKTIFKLKDKTKISKVTFLEKPENFDQIVYRGSEGKVLSPSQLDRIEEWAVGNQKTIGFPCADVDLRASATTGEVKGWLKPGPMVRIEEVQRQGIPGLDSRAASRFDAFEIGQFYNSMLFQLTSRRIVSSGLADYSDFQSHCDGPVDQLGRFTQTMSKGKEHRIRLILGASTQEYPIFKVKWDLYKLDKRASQNLAELHASNREQSITNEFRWYIFSNFPRLSMIPRLKVARYAENFYESVSENYSVALNYNNDDSQRQYISEVAPQYHVEQTFRGAGTEKQSYLAVESKLQITSHKFEYYAASPRTGYQLQAKWWTRKKGLGSSENGDRYQLAGTYLFNLNRWDPPWLVFGLRFKFEQINSTSLADTPPSMRLFLGGDSDLRGFNRKELNNYGLGFNFTGYMGFETRWADLLPYSVQPLLFLDAAKASVTDQSIGSLLFWSPGFGLRWESFFGAIRGTLAYGIVEGDSPTNPEPIPEHWTFFISLGKEF